MSTLALIAAPANGSSAKMKSAVDRGQPCLVPQNIGNKSEEKPAYLWMLTVWNRGLGSMTRSLSQIILFYFIFYFISSVEMLKC